MSHKAVGLLSGGLDSALAAKVLLDQGIEVHAVHVSMPWGCGKPSRVVRIASALGIPLKVVPLQDDYLEILRKPKHGFGSAFNPCVDCHIYMVKKAAEYMREIGGDFVFTGEVLGQRPMSQRRECLGWVEKGAGIEGRLLRPLSALHLDPTIPETEGVVDRSKLFAIDGRSRKAQYALADKLGVEHFAQPGGGCLLTEKLFGDRLKDILQRGCSGIAETAILGLGRYFRLDDDTFVIAGRNEKENDQLIENAMPEDVILRSTAFPGPTVVVRGKKVSEAHLELAAGIIQFFSKLRNEPAWSVDCWKKSEPDVVRQVTTAVLKESEIKKIWVV